MIYQLSLDFVESDAFKNQESFIALQNMSLILAYYNTLHVTDTEQEQRIEDQVLNKLEIILRNLQTINIAINPINFCYDFFMTVKNIFAIPKAREAVANSRTFAFLENYKDSKIQAFREMTALEDRIEELEKNAKKPPHIK